MSKLPSIRPRCRYCRMRHHPLCKCLKKRKARAALDVDNEEATEVDPAVADAQNVEIGFLYQDGEVITPAQLSEGYGLWGEEIPTVVLRTGAHDEWLSWSDFRAEHDPHGDALAGDQ